MWLMVLEAVFVELMVSAWRHVHDLHLSVAVGRRGGVIVRLPSSNKDMIPTLHLIIMSHIMKNYKHSLQKVLTFISKFILTTLFL